MSHKMGLWESTTRFIRQAHFRF